MYLNIKTILKYFKTEKISSFHKLKLNTRVSNAVKPLTMKIIASLLSI